MIFDKLKNIERYGLIHPNLKKVVDFIKNTDLKTLKPGKTIIDGDKIFVMNIEVDTYDDQTAMYEYHARYADLHVLINPKEKFYFDYPENLVNVIKEFDKNEDVALYKKDTTRNLLVPEIGEFILFFPGEAHLPKYTGTLEKASKIVFKVEI